MTFKKDPARAMNEILKTGTNSCVRAGNNSMIYNATHDPDKPTIERICSAGGCELCQANEGEIRGDISKKAQLHDKCRCELAFTLKQIERQKLAETLEVPDKRDIEAIKNELAKARDWGLIEYEKPLEAFGKRDNRDLIAHLLLVKNGYNPKVLAETAPDGYSNIDLLIANEKWEIKSPVGESEDVVSRNLYRATRQFQKTFPVPTDNKNIIFNALYLEKDTDLIPELNRRKNKLGINKLWCIFSEKKIEKV